MRHKIGTTIGSKILKTRVISTEPPYHGKLWEYPPLGYDVTYMYDCHFVLLIADSIWFVKRFCSCGTWVIIICTLAWVGEVRAYWSGLSRMAWLNNSRGTTDCLIFYRNHHYSAVNVMRKCWCTLSYLGYWQVQRTSFYAHNSLITFDFSNSSIVFILVCTGSIEVTLLTWLCTIPCTRDPVKLGYSGAPWSGCRIECSHCHINAIMVPLRGDIIWFSGQ